MSEYTGRVIPPVEGLHDSGDSLRDTPESPGSSNRQDGGLRDALEKLLSDWRELSTGYEPYRDLRAVLAAHPAEPVGVTSQQQDACTCPNFAGFCTAHFVEPVGVSDEAVEAGASKLYERLFHLGITMTEAESATRGALEAAQPLMQPQVVASLPTRERVRQVLDDLTSLRDPQDDVDEYTDKIMALTGGAE